MDSDKNINYDLYDLYIEASLSQINKLYINHRYNSHILAMESVYNKNSISEYLYIQEVAKEERDNKIFLFIEKIINAVKNLFNKIRNNITALLESTKQKKILKELITKIKIDPNIKDITITYTDFDDDVKKIDTLLKNNDNKFKKIINLIKKDNIKLNEDKKSVQDLFKTVGELVEDGYNNSKLTISGKARVVKIGDVHLILTKLSNKCKAELQTDEKNLEHKYKLTLSCISDLNSRLIRYTKINDTENIRDMQEKIALADEQRRLLIKLLGEDSRLLQKKANAMHKTITSISNQINTRIRLKDYTDYSKKHNHNIRYKDISGESAIATLLGDI